MFIVSADSPARSVRVRIVGGVARFRKTGAGRVIPKGYAPTQAKSRPLPFVKDEEAPGGDEGKSYGVVP